MADPAFTPRKIFTDSNYANQAFLAGLGNANVSPVADVVEGLKTGITLGNAAVDLYRKVGPVGQEIQQLKLEAARAEVQTAQSQATIAGVEAKNKALTQQAELDNKLVSLHADNLKKQDNIDNVGILKQAYSGMSQIQDAASLTEFLKQSDFSALTSDKEFGSLVRTRASTLLRTAKSPQEEVELARSVLAVAPDNFDEFKKGLSSAAQTQLASPSEQAALANSNRPAKLDKYSTDILKRNERVFTNVNAALTEANVQPNENVTYDPTSGYLKIQPAGGPKDSGRTVKVPLYHKQDLDADARTNATLQEKIRTKDFSPLSAAPQQASRGTGSLAPQPSLAPQAKTVSEMAAGSEDDRQLVTARETVIGNKSNSTFDEELSAIALYAKNSVTVEAPKPESKLYDPASTSTEKSSGMFGGQKLSGVGTYKPEVVKQMIQDKFSDLEKARNIKIPPDLVNSTAEKALVFADKVYKQEVFRLNKISPTNTEENKFLNIDSYLQANPEVPPTAEKKSSESTAPIKNISFVDRPQEVPSEVLDALRQVESGGGKYNTGPMTKYGQAKGPYQILDSTGEKYHKKLQAKDPDYDYSTYNPYNEEQSRQIAQAILADELKRFKGDLSKALTSYHSGPEAARSGNLGPEGKAYAPKIMGILNGISI